MRKLDLLAVGLGGALGAICRFGISEMMNETIPMGTLFVNLLGSFLLGALTGFISVREMASWLRVGLGTGFLGGFTTMSTFAGELIMAEKTEIQRMLVYGISTVVGGILLAYMGYTVAFHRFKEGRGEEA